MRDADAVVVSDAWAPRIAARRTYSPEVWGCQPVVKLPLRSAVAIATGSQRPLGIAAPNVDLAVGGVCRHAG